jgi:radical SAM protein with 4Fe4S-binding SPASM domain
MTPEEFSEILKKIHPFTDYIYLHVLGEPLLHPQFANILKIAGDQKINVNITTNGTLIKKQKETLLKFPIRQINISLHDAEESISVENQDEYLNEILAFSSEISEKTYVNLRLWNEGVNESREFNRLFINKICDYYGKSTEEIIPNEKDSGIKLADHIFFQPAPRFGWPDGEKQINKEEKTCYALRDHIAILAEGTVVPCCLDADAHIVLGNIFTHELDEILQSERAQKMRQGFFQGKITERFCESCGFILRN